MDGARQRTELLALMRHHGVTMTELSRVIGRNAAWMQQFMKRGTPRQLPERERGVLARFFGVEESRLGGPALPAIVSVPRFASAASAGSGRLADDFRDGAIGYAVEELGRLGIRAEAASVIGIVGDSMSPTLADGDEILVDRDQRSPRGERAIWVIRVDGELRAKRLRRGVESWQIVSDNPDWPEEERPAADVEILGRVVHLRRRL